MPDGSHFQAAPGKRGRIGQAIAICLLGLFLAITAMALFVHGEALNQPSSVTTTPPSSASVHSP
jgi:hypothetical protein